MRDSTEDMEMNRVSVAEVHHTYNADDRGSEIEVHKPDDEEQETGQPSTLRRWPSQESLERASSTKGSSFRQSSRRASDVGSINPTWRDEDDDHGVGYAAVQGHRPDDTRDSESEHDEHDLTREEDDDDRSTRIEDRDSLVADYERPEGVATTLGAAAAVGDDDTASHRSSIATSSQMYQSQARTPSPTFRPQSPLGLPAPAGVSSGLAGLGEYPL